MLNSLTLNLRLTEMQSILVFFLLACCQLVEAIDFFIPRGGDCSHFAVQAEYLYLQPFFDNDFIAAPNINSQTPFNLQPEGPGKKNKFDYTPAYRLSAWYSNPNSCHLIKNACLRFTYLSAHHSKKFGLGSFLSALAASTVPEEEVEQLSNTPGLINSKQHLNYYAGDLLATFGVFDICPFRVIVQPGLHYAFMEYKTHVHFSTKDNPLLARADLNENSKTSGLGPQLGFKLTYQLCNWLHIHAGVRGGLLVSRAKARFKVKARQPAAVNAQIDQNLPVEENIQAEENLNSVSSSVFDPQKRWAIFPFWDTNLGLCASFSTCGYLLEIEIGYEYLTYPNFINRIRFPSNGSLSTDKVLTNFDFQGPYASLTIIF